MDSIGLIELNSIAVGFYAADAMVKAASVKIIEALPICPGKFMVLVGGEVADITNAVEVGVEVAGDTIVDSFIIPRVHPQVFGAINAVSQVPAIQALGIVETFTIASGIIAADAAVKAAAIDLVEIRLSRGQGGKAYFSLTGEVGAVAAAVEAAVDRIGDSGLLLKAVTIPSPHTDLMDFLY
ncbi:MAG: BMC domain-containing protein [Firmicutes bacterium]|nr:BMC domain-containing protein [Bacillota bacterium]